MRAAPSVVLVTFAACGFEGELGDSPTCAQSSDALVACYQFDDEVDMFVDGSANALHASASGFTRTTRSFGDVMSPAVLVGAGASALVPQDPRLELTGNFTIAAWLRPIQPTAGNHGVVDHDGQWSMSIDGNLLTCWFSNDNDTVKRTIPIASGDVWQFAACTVAGNVGCVIRIDQAGPARTVCSADLTGDVRAGSSGVSIGSFLTGGTVVEPFEGAIDDLRVYARALSAAELCAVAGRTRCD